MALKNKYHILFILLCSLVSCAGFVGPVVASDELQLRSGKIKSTYESIKLPGDESMGLIGLNYLIRFDSSLYAGVATYGAVTGKRGGFFTGGIEVGRSFFAEHPVRLDTGVFIGGGGGGSAPQGGGLMLRPHLDVIYRADEYGIGLSVSHIRFPNGDIQSSQLGVVFESAFYSLFTSYDYQPSQFAEDWQGLSNDNYVITPRNSRFSVDMRYYAPSSGSRRVDASLYSDTIGLVGVKLRKQLDDERFWGIATHGAYAGGVDGYMQIAMDGGYSYSLSEKNSLSAALVVGAGGGGKVDTGGGLLAGFDLGMDYKLSKNFALGLSVGYINAPDGNFSAYSYALSGSISYDTLSIDDFPTASPEYLFDDHVSVNSWRWRLAQQSYDFSGNRRVDLFAAMAEVDIANHSYLTGQAYGAYDGGAGGYAVGLLGYGMKYPLLAEWLTIIGEVAVGAAGGGGIDVGSGFVVQPMAAISMMMADDISIQVGSGVFAAPKSDLSVKFVQISVNYSFGRVVASAGN